MKLKKYILSFIVINTLLCLIYSLVNNESYLTSNEQEILKFLNIINTFLLVWLVIQAKESNNERYIYFVFLILTNQFYKISENNIVNSSINILFILFLTGILINVVDRKLIIQKIIVNKRKIIFVFSILMILFLLNFGCEKYKQHVIKEKNRIIKVIEEKKKAREDSITVVNNEREALRLERLKSINCHDFLALENFKSYIELYYPLYEVKGNPKIIDNDDCTFIISSLLKKKIDPYHLYDNQPFIVNLDLNPDGEFAKYRVKIIDKGAVYNY
jgi:hypothetical protein